MTNSSLKKYCSAKEMNPAILRGIDNDSYALASCDTRFDDSPKESFCGSCGWKVDWTSIRPNFELKKRFDVSSTYDGLLIVSDRVSEILKEEGVEKDEITQLSNIDGFFAVTPKTVVRFDTEKRRTRLLEFCDTCGRHGTVAGASPAFLKDEIERDFSIGITDTWFGSHNERHPLVLVSPRINKALRFQKLSGIELENIKLNQALQTTSASARRLS